MSTPSSPTPRPEPQNQTSAPGSTSATLARTLFPLTLLLSQTYAMTDVDGTRYEWDVTLGLRLAEARTAEVLAFCPAEHCVTTEHIRQHYPDIDEAYASALTRDDLVRPLLFLLFAGKHLLVDGWHRLWRCVTANEEDTPKCLPAYLLTKAEADEILLDRVPGATASTPGMEDSTR